MTTFDTACERVKRVIFDLGYGYKATDDLVGDLAIDLIAASAGSIGCLNQDQGGGVFIWVKTRLLERNFFEHGWNTEPSERIVSGVFHFWPWDEEKYGEWHDDEKVVSRIEERLSGVQRSPIERLRDAKPICRTTHKVAQLKGLQCTKCKRWYLTKERLEIHKGKCKG